MEEARPSTSDFFLFRHGESRTVNVSPRERQAFESPFAVPQALGVSRTDLGGSDSSDQAPVDA